MTDQNPFREAAASRKILDSATYSSIPEKLRSMVWAVVESASAMINTGVTVPPCVIVGNVSQGIARRIDIDVSSTERKLQSSLEAKELASEMDADFSITTIEAWTLKEKDLPLKDEIVATHGSLKNYPGRAEVVCFILETHGGVYASQAVIERLKVPGSNVRVMLDPSAFALSNEIQGNLVGVLTPQVPKKMRSRMH